MGTSLCSFGYFSRQVLQHLQFIAPWPQDPDHFLEDVPELSEDFSPQSSKSREKQPEQEPDCIQVVGCGDEMRDDLKASHHEQYHVSDRLRLFGHEHSFFYMIFLRRC